MVELIECYQEKWNNILNEFPNETKDVYYTKEYYDMYEANKDGKAILFVYESEKNYAIYPFMLNEIQGYNLNTKYYDIETAYGYGGPIVNCNDKNFINDFEMCFSNYCKKNNIVAEFIRFHPLLHNETIFKKNIEVLKNRTTVWVNTEKDVQKIWDEDIKSKNRNMIRKAIKNNLYVEIGTDFRNFQHIYNQTMNKVGAENYYYFNDNYYKHISNCNKYVLFNVKKEDITIASSIFMGCGEYFHYHLSGSLKEYLKFSPNNLMLWEAINYAHNNGYKKFHLGGGLTNSKDDSLFKFKKSFSNDLSNFYIGKRIHNIEIYDYLIQQWKSRNNNKKVEKLLQYKIK